MSKLETAFSKALKERESAINREVLDGTAAKLDPANAADLATPPTRNQLVTARYQIKNIACTKKLTESELANKRLIYPKMKDSKLLNVYRNLRTKLLSASSQGNFVTMVTSVVSGGGSSLISANLAAAFAFDEGKTALLLEGNVHSHSLGQIFDLPDDTTGILDFLETDSLEVSGILHETGIPRLRVIPSGRNEESAAEFFSSSKMRSMLKEIKSRYPERYPIIDAPSIKESADARIIMDLCDHVILVIPYGLCTDDDIKSAVQSIGREKLTGVVLNEF